MDLNIREESTGVRDWSWLGSTHAVDSAKDVTVVMTGFTKATHYPDGFIKPGTLLARYDGGADDDLWAAYVHDHSGGLDLDTARAVVLDGFKVNYDIDGNLTSTKTAGSVLLDGYPVEIIVANLPGLLDDADADYAPVAADLPSTFFAADR